ncbi:hypothetical protein C0Q70_04485 [Pomacea canaliculata]|uniref:Uncharacterized protein n=1 Tax=Pomacea canaliculata TaxID=400727 RepID=A0A2T7PIJ7_POMCA|nr:hypothetical protein C0Q70_04485 [Pomacea canaliculata]
MLFGLLMNPDASSQDTDTILTSRDKSCYTFHAPVFGDNTEDRKPSHDTGHAPVLTGLGLHPSYGDLSQGDCVQVFLGPCVSNGSPQKRKERRKRSSERQKEEGRALIEFLASVVAGGMAVHQDRHVLQECANEAIFKRSWGVTSRLVRVKTKVMLV